MNKVPAGRWVEIEKTILTPEQRAPQVPEDTAKTPYIMKVSGFLEKEAAIGDEAVVKTMSGRKVSGKLSLIAPHYEHSFGDTVEEILKIGRDDL
ncbi:MAG: hypothetical protein GX221_07230 [Candidatus Riflebacteria bacterium]|nr:hypothetical protein [Candidatus Riflebacteria bacterium]